MDVEYLWVPPDVILLHRQRVESTLFLNATRGGKCSYMKTLALLLHRARRLRLQVVVRPRTE